MFDVAPTELMLVALVALLVIGPKDLPKAMRFVGQWVAKARGAARHFRSGIDTMMREAELEEMQKKWAEVNAKIMAEHPLLPDPDAQEAAGAKAVADKLDERGEAPTPSVTGVDAAEPSEASLDSEESLTEIPTIAPGSDPDSMARRAMRGLHDAAEHEPIEAAIPAGETDNARPAADRGKGASA